MVLMKRNGNSTIFLITTVVGLNIEQINRGGLHEISDNFFILINKMELVDVLIEFIFQYIILARIYARNYMTEFMNTSGTA